MKRFIYCAMLKDGEEEKITGYVGKYAEALKGMVGKGILMTISIFKIKKNLFLYYECTNEFVSPLELLPSLSQLLEYRLDEVGSRCWIPMMDIFHFSHPVSMEHWRRKRPVEGRIGKIARIKPEMLSSYIYHHYMLQEEQTFINNKYCIIGLDENLIFYYEEQPCIPETSQLERKLKTSVLPRDWQNTWQELMDPHFILWEDAPEQDKKLKPCEVILEL